MRAGGFYKVSDHMKYLFLRTLVYSVQCIRGFALRCDTLEKNA